MTTFATTHKLAKSRIEVYMIMSMWKEMDILAFMGQIEQKGQNIVSNKK